MVQKQRKTMDMGESMVGANTKVAAVVAEFNPFHNGHKYLLKKIKSSGFEFVIAVMSGSFVQRGEPAIADKFVRAKAALAAGFSMVLQLPTRFCLTSAQGFALAAVYSLENTGIVDDLFFGSESGELEQLKLLQTAMHGPEFEEKLKLELKTGVCYPQALEHALKQLDIGLSLVKEPNDVLALEYLNALDKLKSKIVPHPVKRAFVNHDNPETTAEFASGFSLRKKLKEEGLQSIKPFVPPEVFEVYEDALNGERLGADARNGERAVIFKLRNLSHKELEKTAGVSEGLENKLIKELKTAQNLEELAEGVKSKRYIMRRVRRVIFSAFLGVEAESLQQSPSYIRVLGYRKDAECLAGLLGKQSRLPVVYNINRAGTFGGLVNRELGWEAKATDAYALFLPNLGRQGVERIEKFITL